MNSGEEFVKDFLKTFFVLSLLPLAAPDFSECGGRGKLELGGGGVKKVFVVGVKKARGCAAARVF